jgi:hypothetical protein
LLNIQDLSRITAQNASRLEEGYFPRLETPLSEEQISQKEQKPSKKEPEYPSKKPKCESELQPSKPSQLSMTRSSTSKKKKPAVDVRLSRGYKRSILELCAFEVVVLLSLSAIFALAILYDIIRLCGLARERYLLRRGISSEDEVLDLEDSRRMCCVEFRDGGFVDTWKLKKSGWELIRTRENEDRLMGI